MALTDEQKQERLLEIMSIIESLDSMIEFTKAVYGTPFNQIDAREWTVIQDNMPAVGMALETMKKWLTVGSVAVDNDALYSHIQAAIDPNV